MWLFYSIFLKKNALKWMFNQWGLYFFDFNLSILSYVYKYENTKFFNDFCQYLFLSKNVNFCD